MRTVSIASLSLVLVSATWAGTAAAQGAVCRQMRAELASLGSPSQAEAVTQRQRAEVARLSAYYREIGCERGGFSFFGRPAECGAISQRLGALGGLRDQLGARTAGQSADNDRRRQELRAAIARACPAETAGPIERWASRRATGGRRLVCVRLCDGFFFPLSMRPEGGNTAADLCQASCPNADTMVFRAPLDGDIEQAVSERGKPYTQLANASRYQKVLDPSCSCKANGETWAQALRGAEDMLARRKGDVIVTAEKAEELARPRSAKASREGGAKGEAASRAGVDPSHTGALNRR